MADNLIEAPSGTIRKFKDMGDGTFAEVVYIDKPITANVNNNVLQSAGNTSVAQLAAGATYMGTWDSGDALFAESVQVMVTTNQNGTLFVDQSQNTTGTVGVDTEKFVVTAGAPFKTSIGIYGKAVRIRFTNNGTAATTTLAISTIFTPIMSVLPETLTPQGNLRVDNLAGLGTPRSIAVTTASASVALTAATCRITMTAIGCAMRVNIGAVATTASHYIAQDERMDITVPQNSTIHAIRDTTATANGTLAISELI